MAGRIRESPQICEARSWPGAHSPGGDRITPKSAPAESGGAFQLTEDELAPGGGLPLHVHAGRRNLLCARRRSDLLRVRAWGCPGNNRQAGRRAQGLDALRPTRHGPHLPQSHRQARKAFIIISPGANSRGFLPEDRRSGAAGGEPTEAEMIQRLKDNARVTGSRFWGRIRCDSYRISSCSPLVIHFRKRCPCLSTLPPNRVSLPPTEFGMDQSCPFRCRTCA